MHNGKKIPPPQYTLEYTSKDGAFLSVEFDYYPGRPGKTSGPPENCYPDEPAEVEVRKVVCIGCQHQFTTAEVDKLWETDGAELDNRMEDYAATRYAEEEPDYPDDDFEPQDD